MPARPKLLLLLLPLLPLLPLPRTYAWPIPTTAPATAPAAPAPAPAKIDYYALSAEDFFKLPAVKDRFKETATFSQLDRDLLEAAIFHATNQARAKQKLPPLKFAPQLAPIARQHSDEMVQLQYIEHDSPVPEFHTVTDRFTRAGLKPQQYAENIAMLPTIDAPPGEFKYTIENGVTRRFTADTGKEILPYTYDGYAHACVQGWMDSPHHRANILEPHMTHMAIGLAVGLYEKQDSVLVTQNFSTPLK